MRAVHAPRRLAAVEVYGHALAPALHRNAFGIETDLNPLLLQNLADRVGDVGVFAADQPLALFNDGDAAAEAAIHLTELQTNIAAANDDEMLGQEVDMHHATVG